MGIAQRGLRPQPNARLRIRFNTEDTDPDAPGQLYNLEIDPGETTNLYSKYPKIVKELSEKLPHYKTTGRSAPVRPE